MKQINKTQLKTLVGYINSDVGVVRPPEHEAFIPGKYKLEWTYGGVALVQTACTQGSETVILHRGTKREIFEKIHALMTGIRIAREFDAKSAK